MKKQLVIAVLFNERKNNARLIECMECKRKRMKEKKRAREGEC